MPILVISKLYGIGAAKTDIDGIFRQTLRPTGYRRSPHRCSLIVCRGINIGMEPVANLDWKEILRDKSKESLEISYSQDLIYIICARYLGFFLVYMCLTTPPKSNLLWNSISYNVLIATHLYIYVLKYKAFGHRTFGVWFEGKYVWRYIKGFIASFSIIPRVKSRKSIALHLRMRHISIKSLVLQIIPA